MPHRLQLFNQEDKWTFYSKESIYDSDMTMKLAWVYEWWYALILPITWVCITPWSVCMGRHLKPDSLVRRGLTTFQDRAMTFAHKKESSLRRALCWLYDSLICLNLHLLWNTDFWARWWFWIKTWTSKWLGPTHMHNSLKDFLERIKWYWTYKFIKTPFFIELHK